MLEHPSSPCTTQLFPKDLRVFVPMTSRTGWLDRNSWQYWLLGAFPLGLGMLWEVVSPAWAPRQVPRCEERVPFVLPLMQGDSWALGIQQGAS